VAGSLITADGVTFLIDYADHDPAVTGNGLLNDVSLTVVPVPEPSAWALLFVGAGLGALSWRSRRA
jgi:hypothetical protein